MSSRSTRVSSASRAAMNDIVIFDTSVLIDNQRTARHSERMAGCPGRIRNSSVVLAELWRGATVAAERQFVRGIEESRPILAPTTNNWLESGPILARIGDEQRIRAAQTPRLAFRCADRSHGTLPWRATDHIESRGLRVDPQVSGFQARDLVGRPAVIPITICSSIQLIRISAPSLRVGSGSRKIGSEDRVVGPQAAVTTCGPFAVKEVRTWMRNHPGFDSPLPSPLIGGSYWRS